MTTSIKVIDIELSRPLAPVNNLEGYGALLGLVRCFGQPIGCIQAPLSAGSPVDLHATIIEQLGDAVTGYLSGPGMELPPRALNQTALTSGTGFGNSGLFPTVTVAVCTRDRTDHLAKCLDALCQLDYPTLDILVVDNAPSTDATARLILTHYPTIRYVCESQPGLDAARNRAFIETQSEIIAYTDDDCVPDPGWLRALTLPFTDPRVGAVTGLVMPLELDTLAQQRFEDYSANRRIFQPRHFRAPQTVPSTAGIAGIGANMAIRRILLERLGGFDVRFDCGTPTLSGGDSELFARLLEAGIIIAYRPDALVWHRHRRDIAGLRRVIFGYGVGVHAMFWKRFVEDGDWRVLETAPRWLMGPPFKALWNWLRGRPATGADLVLLEFWGAIHGPVRYFTTCWPRRSNVR